MQKIKKNKNIYKYIFKGTAQVKDIKPGVLSKIFSLTEKKSEIVHDENLKKLMNASEALQECLLNYANYKPNKKVDRVRNEEFDVNFKVLIEKIIEFK